jgi:hypothetical protein
MRILPALLIASSLALAVACGESKGVEGSGEVIAETRTVAEFDGVRADNGVIVTLNVDPEASGEIELEISSDSNLLQYLHVEVANGTLLATVEGPSGGARSTAGFQVAATTAALRSISANNGAEVEVSGTGPTLELDFDNGAVADADGYKVETAKVSADNGAAVAVCASNSLQGKVNNGAVVTVTCGGSTTDLETSNGGLIN